MIELKRNIYWVGLKDWELRRFHGEEYSTHRGSTYNSYLIKDKKIALVDTVWTPFHEGFVQQLDQEIGLNHIDLIVINHTEQDHAGSLLYLMEKIPDTPIYCTKNGASMIKGHFQKDWNFNVVKTGDSIELGDYKLVFVEMPMLHWPDSMATYVAGANVLLSNDAFGQHASGYHEGTVSILYDTMWGATKKMAIAVAKGLENKGIGVKLFNVGRMDKNDIITEVFKAKGIIMGSSTINKGILSDTASILEMMKGLKFKDKIGSAFGSYGWSGESPKIIEQRLTDAGFDMIMEPIKMKYDPTTEDLKECEMFGEQFAVRMKEIFS